MIRFKSFLCSLAYAVIADVNAYMLSVFFGIMGFFAGLLLCFALLVSNKTLNGDRSYLYPLIPYNGKALRRLLIREPISRDNT